MGMKSSSISGKKEEKATKVNSGSSDMHTTRTYTLPVSALLPSPVRVRLHTSQFIDSIAASIKADRPVDGIVVARVGDKYYIVDGHARLDAYMAAELAEVVVSEELVLDDIAQVVIEHVKRNITSPLNPLNVANAIAFLAKHGIKDPYAAIPLSEVMKRAVQLILGVYDTELRALLQKYLQEKAVIFSEVEMLPHFFIAVYGTCSSDIPSGRDERERKEEIQRRMRALIENILRYLNMLRTQERFVFPTPDQITAIAASLKQRKTLAAIVAMPTTPSLSTAAAAAAVQKKAVAGGDRTMLEYGGYDDDGDDDGGGTEHTMPVVVAGGGKKGTAGGGGMLLPDNNKSIMRCIHCGKQQVVDMSTGTVCRIEEFGPIRVIRNDDGNNGGSSKEVFCLSQEQAEFLGLASGTVDVDDIKQLMTDRKSEVEKFLKRVSIATRFVVIAVDHEV